MAILQGSVAGAFGGFWLRLVARVIDTFLVGIILVVIELVARGALYDYDTAAEEGVWVLIYVVGQWLYFAGLHASEWQATVGKRLLGLRVVDAQGQRISFGRATGRYFAEILSALILLIGYLMVAFTERKQGLHDMLASTFVLRTAAGMQAAQSAAVPARDVREPLHTPVPGAARAMREQAWADAPQASGAPEHRLGSAAGRRWVLAGFSDSGEVQRLMLQEADFRNAGGELVLGRNADRCHLVVPDMTVSGVHAKLRLVPAGLEAADLGSTNGTAVNGAGVAPGTWRRLGDGDLVVLGGTELRVFWSEG